MLCLKTSSGLVRKREPSGAEGLPAVLFNLGDNLQTALANVATEELRSVCIYLQKTKIKGGLNTSLTFIQCTYG